MTLLETADFDIESDVRLPFSPEISRLKMNNHLSPRMNAILTIAGWYNIVAGLSMVVLYHEGFKMLGLEKPEMNLPIQLVGCLVAIFGIGYLMVRRNPVENRNLLLLGFLSKLLGPLLAIGYIAEGSLPLTMLPVLFFADLIYLVPFWMIYRSSCELAKQRELNSLSATDEATHIKIRKAA